MARFVFNGVFTDGMGRAVDQGTVVVTLAGMATPATIYAAKTGGIALPGASLLTTGDGSFVFYIDDVDHAPAQEFDLEFSKTGFVTKKLLNNLIVAKLIAPGAITTVEIADGTILNADISATAAIAQSKLVDIVDADISATAAIAQSKLVDIVDADISATAAIAQSKLVDIVDADISATAAIAQSKLVNIVDADIAAGAAIIDTKLATITTASKVSDTALNIPNVKFMSTYADFATAVSTIGATVTTLIVSENETVATAIIVPATLDVQVMGTGKFVKSGTGAITFNGSLEVPDREVFSGFADSDILLPNVEMVNVQWFSGATVTLQMSAAAAALNALDGVVLVPATVAIAAYPALPEKTTVIDYRGGGSGGVLIFKSHSVTGTIGLNVTSQNAISGNAISILGDARLAGIGVNIIGVQGVVANPNASGVFGVNEGSGGIGGPGVQGDTLPGNDGGIGVLGTSGAGGSLSNPQKAIEGLVAGAGIAIAGFFSGNSTGVAVVDVRYTGVNTSSPPVISAQGSSTFGTPIQIKNTDTGGKTYQVLSGGSTSPIGVGGFDLFNVTNNLHPFSVDGAAVNNTLIISSSGRILNTGRALSGFKVLTYGVAVTMNAADGNYFSLTVTDGGAHTIGAPSNPVQGAKFSLTIINTFGVIATTAFNVVFKQAGFSAPAIGFNTSANFGYDGANWVQLSPWTSGIPN